MNLKIALLTESFPPVIDGVSATVDSYASYIHSRGGTVTVVTPRMPIQNDHVPRYPVIEYPTLGTVAEGEYPLGFPFLPKTKKLCRQLEPDVIHAHSPFLSMSLALYIRKKLRKPVILTLHTKYSYEVERFVRSKYARSHVMDMMMRHINAADEIWVSSMSAAHELKRLGYTGGHFYLPKGTDFAVKEMSSEVLADLRTRFNVPYNVPVLLYAGRLVWHKNIRNIIDALDALRERKQAFRMLFVGEGPDRTSMEDYTAELKLDGLVHFVGRITDRTLLQSFYSFADLMVFPSVFDNGPQVILEASACSLPSLVARNGAASELITDGVSGFVCDVDPRQLADGIEAALSDRRLLRRVGAAARSQIYKPWDQVVERVCRRYEIVSKLYTARQAEEAYALKNSKLLNMKPVKYREMQQ